MRNSVFVLSRLQKILQDRSRELNSPSVSDYDNPSWAYKAAHINGRKEENRQILKLLEFLE